MAKQIIIHQSTYGEVQKGHDLIQSTFSNPSIAKKIKAYTDLFPKAPIHRGSIEVYISGFFKENYFILTKTFSDASASRSGMVYTHALWIKKEDIGQVNNLKAVLDCFPSKIDKEKVLKPLHLEEISLANPENKVVLGVHKNAIDALLNNQKPIVWIGESDFENFIVTLWDKLPIFARLELVFRLSFSPEDIEFLQPNIVYIPEHSKGKWNSYFKLSSTTAMASLAPSLAVDYLLKEMETGQPLYDLTKQLELSPQTFEQLQLLEAIYQLLQKNNQDFSQILRLVRFLDKYGALTKSNPFNEQVFRQLKSAITNASKEDFIKIRNLSFTYNINLTDGLLSACQQWLHQNIMTTDGTFISKALLSSSFRFKTIIVSSIRDKFEAWKSSYASTIWSWLIKVEDLFKLVLVSDDKMIEKDLVNSFPSIISKSLGEKLINFSATKNWLNLHGTTLPICYSATEAIQRQLAIDTSKTHIESLRLLIEKLPPQEVLNYVLETNNEDRLVQLTGELCATNTSLLNSFLPNNNTWRKIWIASFDYSKNIWNGIRKPESVLFSLLDELLAKNIASEQAEILFSTISQSKFNDLLEYSKRSEIWKVLPTLTKNDFLKATALKWLTKFEENKTASTALELELKNEIIKQIPKLIDSQYSIRALIGLFEKFNELREYLLLSLIDKNYLSIDDVLLSKRLGKLINAKKWQNAYDKIKHLKYRNKTLEYALDECQSLKRVSFFSKLLGTSWDDKYSTKEETNQKVKHLIFDLLRKGEAKKAIDMVREWNNIENMYYNSMIINWYSRLETIKTDNRKKTITREVFLAEKGKLIEDISESIRRW